MQSVYECCTLCKRLCKVNRITSTGYCGETAIMRLGKVMLHHFEEPPISGTNGSGAIFFSGCALKCCYCQNSDISICGKGKEITQERLAEIMLSLQSEGAHNINLVTASHFVPTVANVLETIKPMLTIPVIYNCSGYETVETLKLFKNLVDIYIPDLKYKSVQLATNYSTAPDYFVTATAAIRYMHQVVGVPQIEDGLLKSGVIIRHLILPKSHKDSIEVIDWIADTFAPEQVMVSLMSQYTPHNESKQYPHLNRRIYSYEYNKVLEHLQQRGLKGFMQQRSSAKSEYTPTFDLDGV